MNRKFLEDLGLEKEVIDKIMTEHGNAVEAQKLKYEGVIANKDTEIATANTGIKGFEGINVDEIKAKITQYEADIVTLQATHTQQLQAINFSHALDAALASAGARNLKAVKALLDTDGLKLDGDKIIGFDDMIKPVIAENPFLFAGEQPNSPKLSGFGINQPHQPLHQNPWAKETYNLTKQGEIYAQNPELAKGLAAQAGVKSKI